jgi:hypothetical protein
VRRGRNHTGKSALVVGGALFFVLVFVFGVLIGRHAPDSSARSVRAATPRPAASAVPNAIALLYVPGPFRTDYEVSAEMRLPRRAKNRSWYTVWLMLVRWPEAQGPTRFVQGGLMRWAANRFALTAFTTDEAPGVPLVYADRGDLRDGWHRVTLRGDATFVDLLVDERLTHRWDRKRILGAGPVYVQIGAELNAPGDAIGATVRSVTVKRDGDARAHSEPIACEHHDRGLRFRRVGAQTFEAIGTFNVTAPSAFVGCNNFAAAKR